MRIQFTRMDYLTALIAVWIGTMAYYAWATDPPVYTESLEHAVYFDKPLNSKHVTMRETNQ